MKLNEELIVKLIKNPIILAYYLDLNITDFDQVHNHWLRRMISHHDYYMMAYRGSFKTTIISIAILILIIINPNIRIALFRKTQALSQGTFNLITRHIKNPKFQHYYRQIWGLPDGFEIIQKLNNDEFLISTRVLDQLEKPTLSHFSIEASITGNRFDKIFMDDVTGLKDRLSAAERIKVSEFFSETENVLQMQDDFFKKGSICLTGTKWHTDDLFTKFEKQGLVEKYPATKPITKSMNEKVLKDKKKKLTLSLFSANLLLEITHDLEATFSDIKFYSYNDDFQKSQLIGYCDPSYKSGKKNDYFAFVCGFKKQDKFYIHQIECWKLDIDNSLKRIQQLYQKYNLKYIKIETNGDKGLFANILRKSKLSNGVKIRVKEINNTENKYYRIERLLPEWENVFFNSQITEYEEKMIDNNEYDYEPALVQLSKFVCDENQASTQHDDVPDALEGLIFDLKNSNKKVIQNIELF